MNTLEKIVLGGSALLGGVALYFALQKPAVEGDYSVWDVQWRKNVQEDWRINSNYTASTLRVYESLNKVMIIDQWFYWGIIIVNATDGTLIDYINEPDSGTETHTPSASFQRYFAYHANGTDLLKIMKDGSEIQSIDLNALLGWTGNSYNVLFSADGKYILVHNFTPFGREMALFKASS